MNLGCATGHPSFVMSASFTNQVLAQLALWQNKGEYQKQVYVSQRIGRRSGPPALGALGVELTKLTADQSKYLGTPVEDLTNPTTIATSSSRAGIVNSGVLSTLIAPSL